MSKSHANKLKTKRSYLVLGMVILGIGAITGSILLSHKKVQDSVLGVTTSLTGFFDNFNNTTATIDETGLISEASSPYYWVNSGGYMTISNGRAHTAQGNVPSTNRWKGLYATANSLDTDSGSKPQNIFRLVHRVKYQNLRQQTYFSIINQNMTDSPNRNASNGVLHFNRYVDSNNLYYTGFRVDGFAIIKKKINGTYYTMGEAKIYNGNGQPYNRDTNPTLLPKFSWIGLRTDVQNQPDGSVNIRVYSDKGWSGTWTLVLEATDDGTKYGGAPIKSDGYTGIRTDFMDIDFDDYRVTRL